MFDPKQLVSSMAGHAPQFLLNNFPSVIMGVMVAYGVLLFFLGTPPFFSRVAQIVFLYCIATGIARAVRYGVAYTMTKIDKTTPDGGSAGETMAAPAESELPATD